MNNGLQMNICSANEWTSLYVIGTSTMKELTKKL